MKNVTLALDEATLTAGRDYARRHRTSLNRLIRELLRKAAVADQQVHVREMFRLMDRHPGNSRGQAWKREDLYGR